ncbi:hypothetical protein DPMN_128801 [Dreissena polymorpha]|uniref:Uncharacterized protein n=1 Tax=Dreissena polymorpha TaxID=45954 RepID=A0A9D4H4L3_DREPO|nr:hypothetical protein DPMN_128801 [Dreissena polymorpha]
MIKYLILPTPPSHPNTIKQSPVQYLDLFPGNADTFRDELFLCGVRVTHLLVDAIEEFKLVARV